MTCWISDNKEGGILDLRDALASNGADGTFNGDAPAVVAYARSLVGKIEGDACVEAADVIGTIDGLMDGLADGITDGITESETDISGTGTSGADIAGIDTLIYPSVDFI